MNRREELDRQVRRTLGDMPAPGTAEARLLELVRKSYEESEARQTLLNRSIELISEELRQQNAELQQRLAEVRLQAWVLEHIHDAALLLDVGGAILHVYGETARLFGQESQQMTGKLLDEFISARGGQVTVRDLIRQAWELGSWTGDVAYKRPQGHEGTLELTLVVVSVEDDLSDQILVVAHDVTEARLEAQRWMQSEKLKGIGQLAAGVAHEINTPAQYISDNIRFLQDAFAQLLADGSNTPSAETREFLLLEIPQAIGQSLQGMERIADIVRGIKLFAHPGSGERAAIDLNREIETSVTVSRNEWKYTAELVTDLDPDLPPVPGFSGELGHVFLNLIVNAAHAISGAQLESDAKTGVIRVTSRREAEWVEVRVADNGPGIPESVRNKVFDPFFTTKPVGKGTGQGLAICHRVVVEMHGGTIHFESSPGSGTTFVVRLPLTEARAAAERNAA